MGLKAEKWTGWAIFNGPALVLFDARCPIYWKRYIAKRAAIEHGLPNATIVPVTIRMTKTDDLVFGRKTK